MTVLDEVNEKLDKIIAYLQPITERQHLIIEKLEVRSVAHTEGKEYILPVYGEPILKETEKKEEYQKWFSEAIKEIRAYFKDLGLNPRTSYEGREVIPKASGGEKEVYEKEPAMGINSYEKPPEEEKEKIVWVWHENKKYKVCKWKCGNYVSWDNNTKKYIHYNAAFKLIGVDCPKYGGS